MKKLKDNKLTGIILALIGSVLMVVGVLKGESASVLAKAIRICLECIGIG